MSDLADNAAGQEGQMPDTLRGCRDTEADKHSTGRNARPSPIEAQEKLPDPAAPFLSGAKFERRGESEMSMKPDAWIISDETTQIVRKAEHVDVNSLFGVKTEPLFSLATIRKWLEEDPSVSMIVAANPDMDMDVLYGKMLAAKLLELEQP